MSNETIKERLLKRMVNQKYLSLDIGTGWYGIIADLDQKLCKLFPEYEILQVKEKFGELCIHVEFGEHPDKVILKIANDLIHFAEYLAQNTCQDCGVSKLSNNLSAELDETVSLKEIDGWKTRLCDTCFKRKITELYDEKNNIVISANSKSMLRRIEIMKGLESENEIILLEHSNKFLRSFHSLEKCVGNFCTIHNRSSHHMRSFPQNWREDRQIMERVCSHGVGHPDPDEIDLNVKGRGVHGCDGCCTK